MNRLKLLAFGLFTLTFFGQVHADLAVDGLYGIDTYNAAQANPELAAQYGITGNMACTGGGGTTNCGASQQNVADFQAAVNGQGSSGGSGGGSPFYEVTLQEPLQGGSATLVALNGVDLINQYFSMIYMWAAAIVGLFAVLIIVVSGIQIIFAGAQNDLYGSAKERIYQALISLLLVFGTALLLKTINPGFFGYF